jgi:XapX domain-containing protein
MYLISIAAGMFVGVIYALLNVRSPAPPLVALAGLFGMLVGEQVVPLARRLGSGQPVTTEWVKTECVPKITGAPSKPPGPLEPKAREP